MVPSWSHIVPWNDSAPPTGKRPCACDSPGGWATRLPYAVASHFAPADLDVALRLYRERFQPPAGLEKPSVIVGLSVSAAPTDEEARHLFTSTRQTFVNLCAGRPGPLPPPVDDVAALCPPELQPLLDEVLARMVVGSPDTVASGLAAFEQHTSADEISVASKFFDQRLRVRSLEIIAQAAASVFAAAA